MRRVIKVGVAKNIEDVKMEFINAINTVWQGEYKFEYLLDKTCGKESYYAVVFDKEGYKYRFRIGEILNKTTKSIIRNNMFAKENYIQYIHNHFKDIVVDKFDYKEGNSKIYYHCTKHLDLGQQETLAKHIMKPTKKFMCKRCAQEYTGECNKLDENDIKQYLSNYNCDYINSDFLEGGKRRVMFKCNHHPEKIQYRPYSAIKISNTPCLYCNKEIARHSRLGDIDDIINSVYFNEEKIELLGLYIDDSTKMLCQCNYCNHQWYATPNKLKQGRGCPNCAHIATRNRCRKNQEEAARDLFNRYPDIKIIGKYINSRTPLEFKCVKCGTEWVTNYVNVYSGHTGCPLCRSSVGEFNIANHLDKNKVYYIRQFSFKDCKNEEPLRFDFYLPKYNCVIEFQGEQHFFPVNFSGNWSKEELDAQFKYTLLRDKIKRDYCNEQGIRMVEIPYWDKNNVELYLENVI